jgi:hypothetical protein
VRSASRMRIGKSTEQVTRKSAPAMLTGPMMLTALLTKAHAGSTVCRLLVQPVAASDPLSLSACHALPTLIVMSRGFAFATSIGGIQQPARTSVQSTLGSVTSSARPAVTDQQMNIVSTVLATLLRPPPHITHHGSSVNALLTILVPTVVSILVSVPVRALAAGDPPLLTVSGVTTTPRAMRPPAPVSARRTQLVALCGPVQTVRRSSIAIQSVPRTKPPTLIPAKGQERGSAATVY